MRGDFNINSFFDGKGEAIEKLLADYFISVIKTANFQNKLFFQVWKEEKCLEK